MIYATYLMTTTNHQAYAQMLLKECTRQLETAVGMENGYFETYSIRAKVEDVTKVKGKEGKSINVDEFDVDAIKKKGK